MKKFLTTAIFMFIFLPCNNAAILTGEIKYDTNLAKNEILSEKPLLPSHQLLKAHIIDTNISNNKSEILKGNTELKDRTLAKFSDGSYGIIYKNNPYNVFYYNTNGYLTHIEIKNSLEYPYKTYKYDTFKNLVNMTLRTSEDETYIFEPSGNLIAHWIGGNCYDENDTLIMTRKIYK